MKGSAKYMSIMSLGVFGLILVCFISPRTNREQLSIGEVWEPNCAVVQIPGCNYMALVAIKNGVPRGRNMDNILSSKFPKEEWSYLSPHSFLGSVLDGRIQTAFQKLKERDYDSETSVLVWRPL